MELASSQWASKWAPRRVEPPANSKSNCCCCCCCCDLRTNKPTPLTQQLSKASFTLRSDFTLLIPQLCNAETDCQPSSSVHSVRSARAFCCGRHAFSVIPHVLMWNALPRHLRDPVHTVSVFRRLVKTFFFVQSCTNLYSALGLFCHWRAV